MAKGTRQESCLMLRAAREDAAAGQGCRSPTFVCAACAQKQYMALMPVGTRLQLKPGKMELPNRVSGEVVRHYGFRVQVLWDDPEDGGDYPNEDTAIMELPGTIIELYEITVGGGSECLT